MQVDIHDALSNKLLESIKNLPEEASVLDLKRSFARQRRKFYPDRQSLRLEPRGRMLKDSDVLRDLGVKNGDKLFFKDLGPQVGWSTVFLAEYAGPLVVYLLFYPRPAIIYGAAAASAPRDRVVTLAAAAWTFHYAKRLLETIFVHRFSHNTMPIGNLFKNCSYYWGFAALVSYFNNHPLYTAPTYGDMQIYSGLAAFVIGELGNFSVHLCFRNMRPEGSKVRKIPVADANPFTSLFSLVSCPNYTYEVLSWAGFSVMSQSLAGMIFTTVGLYQMSMWALGKHRNYRREFKDYPKGRKAILPFIL